jgi:tetratricopeptide (TPR) repeat protein
MNTEALPSAAVTLEEIVAKNPSTALYLPVAERMLARGHTSDAIRLCEERRARPGRGVGDHIVLGRCYLADGRLAQAREQFERALKLDRENVVALKSLAGILSHEGRHAEAADLYRAVCRVDPGDLESQSALHQITSGEYPEVRPPEVIVSQTDVSWQPVRLTREEDHLSELGLGLQTFDSFDAETLRPALPQAPPPEEELAELRELGNCQFVPVEEAPQSAQNRETPAAPSRHEIVVPVEGFPVGGLHNRLGSLDVEEFQSSALERLDQVLRPAVVRSLGEVPSSAPISAPEPTVAPEAATRDAASTPESTSAPEGAIELPASALIDDHPEPARPSPSRSAVWDDDPAAAPPVAVTSGPPAGVDPEPTNADAPPPPTKANRAAFETWVRRLGGKS